jgi:lisH domain-containing protein FOPNL
MESEGEIDLKYAVRTALENRGTLGEIRARIRAEVFQTLENKENAVQPPQKPHDVFLASELIRELLMSFDFSNSAAVFSEESGQPSEMRIDRRFLASELGLLPVESDGSDVPLLILIVRMLKNMKSERIDATFVGSG